jgi:uncharacterized glyoxalase superfamily protein PhnB
MDANGLTWVAPVLHVADLGRALAHYRDRLGFAVEFVHGDFYAGVVRDGCRIHLKQGVHAARGRVADAEHIDACFDVRDARALAARFAQAGAEFAVDLRVQAYGVEFYLRDPDGHVLGFVEAA